MLWKYFVATSLTLTTFLQFVVTETFNCERDKIGKRCIIKKVTISPDAFQKYKFSGDASCDIYNHAYPCVDEIVFEDSEIQIIKKELLEFVGHRKLNISRSKLTSLDNLNDEKCNMTELIARDNEIEYLSGEALSKCRNLNVIDLRNNSIRLVNPDAFLKFSLNRLDLSKNKIKEIYPFTFSTLQQRLSYLDLSENDISEMNDILPSMSQGSIINFSHNLLKKLDVQCFYCESVSKLDLSYNMLRKVSNLLLLHMKNLQTLDLSNNLLEIIKEHEFEYIFSNSSNYNSLKLDHNYLTTLEAFTFSSENLHFLNLSNNNIESIKTNAFVMPNLKVLDLSANSLQKIENHVFSPLNGSLFSLNLRRNNISQIDEDSFSHLHSLQVLIIADNFLKNMKAISNVSSLTYLDLSYNSLGCIEEGALFNLERLRILKLRSTNLENIDNGTFSQQKSLEILDLSYNKFQLIDIDYHQIFTLFFNVATVFMMHNDGLIKLKLVSDYQISYEFDCEDVIQEYYEDWLIQNNMISTDINLLEGICCTGQGLITTTSQDPPKFGWIIGVVIVIVIFVSLFILVLFCIVRKKGNSISHVTNYTMLGKAARREESVSVTRVMLEN